MSRLPEDSRRAYDLRLLADDFHSEAAFARLWELMRERLERAAARLGMSAMEAEDVVQDVAIRLWERRRRLAEMSIGSFWAFAFRSVRNLSIDRGRQRSRGIEEPIEEDSLQAADVPYLDAIVERALERESVYASADRLWLGALDEAEGKLVLAVQMYLLEGLSKLDSGAMLGVSSRDLESALRNPLIVRHALYQALMWENDDLARYVLDLQHPLSGACVERLLWRVQEGKGMPVGPWKPLEAAIVILRILYGMAEDDIARIMKGQIDVDQTAGVIRRAVHAYPFARIAESVASCGRHPRQDKADAGLWRRLVFEYYMRLQLPHRQILERVAPAASAFSFDLRPTTLNSWIGNGRLWVQIASFVANENASRS